jgi:hypothetical protein
MYANGFEQPMAQSPLNQVYKLVKRGSLMAHAHAARRRHAAPRKGGYGMFITNKAMQVQYMCVGDAKSTIALVHCHELFPAVKRVRRY